MTEELGFIRTILDRPCDAGPRKVYADWLEERGRTVEAEQLRVSGTLKVYAVWGSTGEYSDRSDWPVAAYLCKDEAERHAKLASGAVKGADRWGYEQRQQFKNPYDPNCHIDYTGADYGVHEIDLPFMVEDFLAMMALNKTI